jgi:hypothetical protein
MQFLQTRVSEGVGCEAEASAPDNPQARFVEKFSDAK